MRVIKKGKHRRETHKPSDYLRAMRHVSMSPAGADDPDNELHKMCRGLKDRDPEKFLDRLHKAENDFKRTVTAQMRKYMKMDKRALGKTPGAEPVSAALLPLKQDEGTAKARALLLELLQKRGWNDARRTDQLGTSGTGSGPASQAPDGDGSR